MERLQDYIDQLWTNPNLEKRLVINNAIHEDEGLIFSNRMQVEFPNKVTLNILLVHYTKDSKLELSVMLTNNANLEFNKGYERVVII